MAIFREHRLNCPGCGAAFAVHLADSINVARAPEIRQAVLERRLHLVNCPQCRQSAVVAKDFLYVDSERQLRVVVGENSSEETPEQLDDYITHHVATLEGLRELVVANEHGISAAQLELFKVYLVAADPRLHVGTSELVLEAVDDETLTFLRHFGDTVKSTRVQISRRALESMFAAAEIEAKAAGPATFMEKIGAFVAGMSVIFDPSKGALQSLASFARQLRTGRSIDLLDDDFNKMLDGLPSARDLSRSAQADLDTAFAFACAGTEGQVLKRLFESRFGVTLDVGWLRNHSRHDVSVMWAALRDLPDGAVERNDMMKRLSLSQGARGYYYENLKQIDIGSGIVDAGLADLRHCILHEVGHAAHAAIDQRPGKPASAWLAREFGWHAYDPRFSEDIDKWIEAMGGYPADADLVTRQEIRDLIRQSMGGQSTFVAAPIAGHPRWHLWNDPGFGPRAAFERSGTDWWLRCDTWHAANGRCFFVNYYYRMLMEVSEPTMRFVADSAPARYALSAPQEFFAEMFAWHYDLNHHIKAAIPRRIGDWFDANIGLSDGFGVTHSIR